MSHNNQTNRMLMIKMLPKGGMYYTFFADDEKPGSRCILPGWEATEIMLALNSKYDNAKQKDFDTETALLFNKAIEYVTYRISPKGYKDFPGQIPANALFWSIPKRDTVFKDIDNEIVYRFALKNLEARENYIEHQDAQTFERQAPYHCQTAQAIDRFNTLIAAAGSFHGAIGGCLSLFMTASMAAQVEEESEFNLGARIKQVGGQVDKGFGVAADGDQQKLVPQDREDNDNAEHMDVGETGQIEIGTETSQTKDQMDDTTGGYDAYLRQMHLEDMKIADEEDMMEME